MARIIISISQDLLDELDAYRKKHRFNRSEFIRHAVREIIQKDEEPVQTN